MLPNPYTSVNPSRHWISMLAVWSFLCCSMAAFATADAERQFEAARYEEIVRGDLSGAIGRYQQVLTQAAADRSVAARALMRIGLCQEKLGERKAAYATYLRILSEYADQSDITKKATIRIALWSAPRNLRFDEGAPG